MNAMTSSVGIQRGGEDGGGGAEQHDEGTRSDDFAANVRLVDNCGGVRFCRRSAAHRRPTGDVTVKADSPRVSIKGDLKGVSLSRLSL